MALKFGDKKGLVFIISIFILTDLAILLTCLAKYVN